MKTVLVSGASGIVGNGILRSLRLSGENYILIGTTIYKNTIAECFSDIFELAPKTSEDNYIDWLCGIIRKHNVDMIIPGIEADVAKWNENRSVLEKTGASVLLNNERLIRLCSDKWLFYLELNKYKPAYAIPSTLDSDFDEIAEKYNLPFLMKPRSGSASRNIKKIFTREEFTDTKSEFNDEIMAQPIIGNDDEEYTVSGFFDENSQLRAYQQLKRKLSKDGFTESAQTVNIKNIGEILNDLADVFKPVGPTNFQFRGHDGSLKLLEINPRISSSTSIRAGLGYNESQMSVDYILNGKDIEQPVLKSGKAIRYTEDKIVYDNSADI